MPSWSLTKQLFKITLFNYWDFHFRKMPGDSSTLLLPWAEKVFMLATVVKVATAGVTTATILGQALKGEAQMSTAPPSLPPHGMR